MSNGRGSPGLLAVTGLFQIRTNGIGAKTLRYDLPNGLRPRVARPRKQDRTGNAAYDYQL